MLKKKAAKQQAAKAAAKTTTKGKGAAPAPKSAPVTDRRLAAPKPRGAQPITKAGDWEHLAGAGGERVTTADLAIPRLAVLQALSPQVNKQDARFIDGAEPGDICDTVTGVLFDGNGGIIVVPVRFRRAHIEWIPRKKGGGFVADHDGDASILEKCDKDEDGNMVLPNGHEIKIIGEYFVFVVDEATGESTPYVLSMGGTQLKKSRQLNTILKRRLVAGRDGTKKNPPWWYNSFKLTTAPEQNEKGNWFGWVIEQGPDTFDLPDGAAIFEQATLFHEQVKQGRVTARPPTDEEVPTGRDPGNPPGDDEVPY
jgi:hypothetical protein